MKKSLLLTAILFLSLFVAAQNQLLVQKNEQGLYLTHKVEPRESFYSIGRLYNLPPKDIAVFNQLDMNQGLQIDQEIKIPLVDANFSQSADKGLPVYYVVGQKEGLYRVSLNNNNVLMANLRKWNKLSRDNINAGQKLVVGYLVTPESDQVATIGRNNEDVLKNANIAMEMEQEVRKDPPPAREKAEVVETKKAEVVKPVQQAVTDGKGGYFKAHFEAQQKSQSAKAETTAATGIFKTASGWQDEKYYALMDGVDPGTIVKMVNPTNSKVVYAKILGGMSGIRQNQGYDVRISNAAASALGIGDTEKFILKINY